MSITMDENELQQNLDLYRAQVEKSFQMAFGNIFSSSS
jgi:hypothetical protein